MRMLRVLPGIALLLLSLPVRAGMPDEVPDLLRGHWRADSTTAYAISGNITITQSEIIFQNGVRFQLSYLGKRAGLSRIDSRLHFYVFSLRDPRDVRLLNGNLLCGHGGGPRYMAFTLATSSVTGEILDLSAILGKTSPLEQFDRNRPYATFGFKPDKRERSKNNLRP